MNRRFLKTLQAYLALLDIGCIAIVYYTAFILFRENSHISYDPEYWWFGVTITITWMLVSLMLRVYQEKNLSSFEVFTKVSFKSYVSFLLPVTACLLFFRWIDLSRIFIITVLASVFLTLLANRLLYLGLLLYMQKRDWVVTKVMVVGYNSLSKKLVSYLEEERLSKKVIGYSEESENVTELSTHPILCNISDTLEMCKKKGITEIYSTIGPEQNKNIYELIQHADQNCIRFKLVPDMGIFINRQVHVNYVNEIPVMMMRRDPLEDLGNRMKKRLFDILISGIVIVFILSWLIPLMAILIKIESKGPVFFRQLRTGKNNKDFFCLKFRSMRVNDKANEEQARKNDARVTRIGGFLRKTSLDEFPQFLNVFYGQMSIVGPRPHMLKHTDEYSRRIGQYMVRQLLKPGITGWAQVNGCRGETRALSQMQQRVEHDLWYLENWSVLLDLRIVFMTAFQVVKGEENAY